MGRNWKLLEEQLLVFLTRGDKIPPLLFFLQIAYLTLFGSFRFSHAGMVISILWSLVQRTNYFWYTGIILQPGLGYAGIPNILIGLIGCNERWKFLLFVYMILFFLTFSQKDIHYAYNIVALTAIAIETYTKLPFSSLRDNCEYFTGFLSLLAYFGFHFFLKITKLEWENTQYAAFFLAITVGYLASTIIKRRLWVLGNSNFEQIDNPNKIYHYLNIIKERSSKHLEKIGIENIHRLSCKQPDCFCKMDNPVPFERLLLRKLSKLALKKFDSFQFREFLQEMFIKELLDDNMFPLAVENFLRQNNYKWDIFKGVRIARTKNLLARRLQYIESSYEWKTIFQDPFEYEKGFQQLRRYILELIALKIDFWHEIIKKSTKAVKLKGLGKQFLEKLNVMNKFYLEEIAPVEKQIKVFSGAILYNLFLLIGTNYKDVAETNIKALKKSNDPRERKTYKLSIIQVSLTEDRMGIIENLNNNCVKMLGANYSKQDFLGKSVDSLVPESYLQEHCAGMRKLRQFNSKKLVGAELDTTFIVNMNKSIIACSIFYKFSPNIFNQLSIISLLKHYKEDCEYILIDGAGKPEYTSNPKLDVEIVYTKEIQNVMNEFKSIWKYTDINDPIYPLPDPVKIQIKYKESDYICFISSPLCQSFRFPKKPPVHLSIKNQTQTYFHDEEIGEEADMGALKKIQIILDQNETQSQASNYSRRSSIIEVLRTFESNSGVQMFRYYHYTLGIVYTLIIIFILIQYVFTQITWLRSSISNNNSIRLFQKHYELHYWIAGYINKGMSLYGINRGVINNSGYSSSYGTSNYSSATLLQIKNMCLSLSTLVYEKDNGDKSMSHAYFSAIEKSITITERNRSSNIKFNNLVNLAIANCYQMATQVNFWDVAIFNLYWSFLYPNYMQLFTIIKAEILSDLDYYLKLSYLVFFSCSAIILLATIPIYIGNRKIKKEEDYIYDLMTSIDPNSIERDILDLADLEVNLKSNYSATFNFDDKESVGIGLLNQDDEKSEIKSGVGSGVGHNTAETRKRTGELDTKGSGTPRVFLYVVVLIFIAFMAGVFVIRIQFIENVRGQFIKISQLKYWRNQRLDQLINLKKWIYQLRVDEPIENKTLNTWLRESFEYRRGNYPFTDSIVQMPVNCTLATAICKNGTVSQLSVNVFLAQLLTQSYVTRDPQYLGIVAVLKDLSKNFNDLKVQQLVHNLDTMSASTTTTTTLTFILSLVTVFICIFILFFYFKNMKQDYMHLTRFITFLTQEMISKNKRVESYLQRLMKNQ